MIPPDASYALPYWSNLDWKTIGGLAVGIGTIAAPFIRQWRRGQLDRSASQAQAAEAAAARLERVTREQYSIVERQRDYALRAVDEAEAECAKVKLDRDNGWGKGRAMEDEARYQRHEHLGTQQRYEMLLAILTQLIDGIITLERARTLCAMSQCPAIPRPVPTLEDITGRPP